MLEIKKIQKPKPRLIGTFKQYIDVIKFIICKKKEELEISIHFIYRQRDPGKGYDNSYERKRLMDIEIDLLEYDEIYHFNDFNHFDGFERDYYHKQLCVFIGNFIKTLPLQDCSKADRYKLTKQIVDMIIEHCEEKSLYGLTLG